MQKERQNETYEGLIVFKSEVITLEAPEVDRYAWYIFENQIRSKPDSILTLATGSSPLGLYNYWISAYIGGLDCSLLTTKNLDEYWKLPIGHPRSYAQEMKDNLFDHINIPESNRFIADCSADDPYLEAIRYQTEIDRIGPSDITLLGIGPMLTCHIAFNERGSDEKTRTRVTPIDPETVLANARFFERREDVPELAITQGIADILDSKRIVLIAKGLGKAEGIKRTLEGPIGPDAPASFLRLHPNVTFLLDKEAASLLD